MPQANRHFTPREHLSAAQQSVRNYAALNQTTEQEATRVMGSSSRLDDLTASLSAMDAQMADLERRMQEMRKRRNV